MSAPLPDSHTGDITENLNIDSNEALITPEQLKQELPLSGQALANVRQARETVFSILDRKDPRLFIVVGPCSIHDTVAAIDYAKRLKVLAEEVQGYDLSGDAGLF